MSYESGELQLFFGPMRSGKSTKLLRIEMHHTILGHSKAKLFIPFISSVRKDAIRCMVSLTPIYVGTIAKDNMVTISEEELLEMLKYDVILIDEGQFIDNIVEIVMALLDKNKTIHIAGLSGDSNGNLMGKMHLLIPHANKAKIITGHCDLCVEENGNKNSKSVYSIKVDPGEEIINVNGVFKSSCRAHAKKYIKSLQ